MHIHLNPIGGLAGDMFCAALLDARPELFPELRRALVALEPPRDVDIRLEPAPGALSGKRFLVDMPAHTAGAHHPHTHYRDIRRLLDDAPLDPEVRRRAQAIFRYLAVAEAQVHQVEVDAVAFHEVGNWDSIVDIVSAAFLLERCGVTSASTAPLPLGGGRVNTAHGLLPVPAPATARLLRGLPVTDDGIGGERVTPTGAAILRALEPAPGGGMTGVLAASGYGFGGRSLEGVPNCVQVLLLEQQPRMQGAEADWVLELEFEVDDQSPEDLAGALDRLRALDGVLSITTLQAIGKGGRPTMQIRVLGRPEEHRPLVEACFRETTTIGLRWRETARWVLPRRSAQVSLEGRDLEVKLVGRAEGESAKAEQRSLAGVEGQARRRRLRGLAEEAALTQNPDHERYDD